MTISRSLARTLSRETSPRSGLAEALGEFVGDLLQGFIAQFQDGGFVVGQGIVEAYLIHGQPQCFPSVRGFTEFLAISISSSMTCAVSMARFW